VKKFFLLVAFLTLPALIVSPAFQSEAEEASCTLKREIQAAVLSNPDVQEKWHSFLAAGFEEKAAEAGLGPRVDVTAGYGRDSIDGKGYEDRDFFNYNHNGVAVTLRQLVYDGGLTRSEIQRLANLRKARYLELLSAVESVTLETVRAYGDVGRYRTLVDLASENLERHKTVMSQVEERVSRGVDSLSSLKEIRGRLAVASVNLLTEQSNLHDVSARYERVTGHVPPKEMEPCDFVFEIPTCAEEALERALENNPSLLAQRYASLAAEAALAREQARMSPRVEIKGGYRSDHDVDGVDGRKDKWYGEITMTYALYDGGAAENRTLQHRELALQAEKRHEVTKRDILQTLKVAYNDLRMLEGQMGFLEQHSETSGAVRDAYLQQFRIGRRGLLDLLDGENEYYQAGRALHNARFNILIAKARILAATGRLSSVAGSKGQGIPSPGEIGVSYGGDASGCMAQPPGPEGE